MATKLLTFFAAVALVMASSSAVSARDYPPLNPLPEPLPLSGDQVVDRFPDDNLYIVNYCANLAYYLSAPDPNYGDTEYAQRFTICGPDSIKFVIIPIYDEGTGTFGNDDVYCTIYEDDGNGFPGAMIAQDVAPAGSYTPYPDGTVFFDEFAPIPVDCEFHIAFSSSATIDHENIMMDDGTNGQGRGSSKWTDGNWHTLLEGFDLDANFNIFAFLTIRDRGNIAMHNKMHWPQYPDTTGWDVMATYPFMLADDWQCSEEGWIKNIHFWGSWMGGTDGFDAVVDSFLVRIHEDIPDPDGSGPAWSMPGPILWERMVRHYGMPGINYRYTYYPIESPPEGWYDPVFGEIIFEDHFEYIRYEICLDSLDWFWQYQDTVYWLSISAFVREDEPADVWGWKSSRDHWNDDAVWAPDDPPYNWTEIYDPGYPYIPGDVNGDGIINVIDIAFYTDYLYSGGAPPPYVIPGTDFHPAADCNGNCIEPEIADLNALAGGTILFCPDYPPEGEQSLDLSFVVGTGCGDELICDCVPGEVNNKPPIDILDIVRLINYKYKEGDPPEPYEICSGDANCDCVVNITDIVRLINYKYKEGDPPCSCEDWVAECGLPLRK